MDPRGVVIIGGGLCGGRCAETLREEGHPGPVTIIAAEPELPYERPPLSKSYLAGESERREVFVHDQGWWDAHDVTVITSDPATAIDADQRTVVTQSGRILPYEHLLLATGSRPRRLKVPGAGLAGVHYLRTLADSEALRTALGPGDRDVVIVGAGWIGLETAAAARGYGNRVTIIEPQPTPLASVLGTRMGEVFAELHRDHGVTLLTGTSITAITGQDQVAGIVTTTDQELPADLVIVGVGIEPVTDLAAQAGLAVDNGVVVDEHLRTDRPGILAAGDVASIYNPLLGRHVRLEHWANALDSGPAAARTIMGRLEPYAKLPYFYSDQYDLGMEYSGMAAADDEVIVRGDLSGREFIAFWLHDDRVVAAMNVNVWDVTDDLRAMITAGAPADRDRLADSDAPLVG